jgi:pre-rRNA-processing protein TSR3
VNYARPDTLSSLEALAAALFILGFRELANEFLNTIKWGSTSLTLNHEPLGSYSKAKTVEQMLEVQVSFF